MKKLFLVLMILSSVSSFASNSQEAFRLARQDVLDTLGFDESVNRIEWMEITQVRGADLAILTIVRSHFDMNQAPVELKCVTTFTKAGRSFHLQKTKCNSVN